jgi:hypothetical protein
MLFVCNRASHKSLAYKYGYSSACKKLHRYLHCCLIALGMLIIRVKQTMDTHRLGTIECQNVPNLKAAYKHLKKQKNSLLR